jgi:osmotically inducible protein OsmC
MATRNGSAQWRGDLRDGSGELEVGDGVFSGSYSAKSRFEEAEGTNPDELIAAAHAACFAMALSGILAEAGHDPETLDVSASVHVRAPGNGPAIRKIDLRVEGRVPGIDEDDFRSHAEQAKEGCPVSEALAAVPEITLEATLAS